MWENADQKNSEYEHFLRSAQESVLLVADLFKYVTFSLRPGIKGFIH